MTGLNGLVVQSGRLMPVQCCGPAVDRESGSSRRPVALGQRPTKPLSASKSLASTISRVQVPVLGLPAPGRRSLHLPCRRGTVTAAAVPPRGTVELLLDAAAGKNELLSPNLDDSVRQRAEKAIRQRGCRVTIGDVAGTAGLSLQQADEAVRALASDSLATLEVSKDGEIVYSFPPNFAEQIASKSLKLRVAPALEAVKSTAGYLGRVAFGTALIASVLVVFAAIAVISSSRDDGRGERRGGYYNSGPRFYFDLTDLLWYWDPFYYRHRRSRLAEEQQSGGGMNFLEALFSWVFGDGNPNEDFEKKRWQAIGRYIQARGGVVIAEEMAPFLDISKEQLKRGAVVDESYMVPVMVALNGRPVVDASGSIAYVFNELQQTARASPRQQAPVQTAAFEEEWRLTAASAGQQLGAIALGAVNVVGVAALTFMLADPINQLALARNGLLWVASAMPFLQAYAVAFFAVPLVRSILNKARNAQIAARNAARELARRTLQRPDPQLQQKLAGAAALAKRNVISDRDVVYRSDRPIDQQAVDVEADNFERRLEQRARERQQQQADDSPLWWQQQAQRQQQRDRR